MWKLAFALMLAISQALYSSLLVEERLLQAKNGDYLVIEGGRMTTILSVRSITPASFILEEVSIPSQKLKSPPSSWVDWIKAKAPGHTSWSMIEIDRATKEIIECYSCSKSAWIQLSPQESLITTLLSLSLDPVENTDRRKIGPPPQPGEPDLRKIWSPPMVVEGKKKESSNFDVYQTNWPKDGSELSGHRVVLYFDRELQFPFPFWIQVETTHAAVSLRAIDSGKNLSSPYRSFPRRVPQFVGHPQKLNGGVRLLLKSPKYYKDFAVFAVDVTHRERQICPIAHSLVKGEAESLTIDIDAEALEETLQPDHRYTWLIVPTGHTESYTESPKPFTWTR